MKLRKVFCAAVLVLTIFASSVFAAKPQDALSIRPEDSIYFVLSLSEAGNLSRWVMSQENIDAFMPLILSSESSNEIIGILELVRAITSNTPLKSAAINIGITKEDPNEPFIQMAFTVDDKLAPTVAKIKDGTAEASDFAKLFLGLDSAMLSFAEPMIKTELGEDNVYSINNEIKFKAAGDLLILALSDNDLKAALNAVDVEDARLFHSIERKFDTEDFIFFHADFDTVKTLDNDEAIQKMAKYFAKPMHIELAFKRVPDKFSMSIGFNPREAIKKEYIEKLFTDAVPPVKGCYIDLDNAGGSTSPIFAMGGILRISKIFNNDDLKKSWEDGAKLLQQFTGITEAELAAILNGAFSIVVNDVINIQGFKVPALYMSFKGEEGAPAKIFDRLANSKFFARIQDKILQADSSISPVSFLVINKDESLALDFADLTSLNEKPELSGKFAEVMNNMGISVLWLDFEGIQKWISDNSVMEILTPMAKVFGYGKIAEDAAKILSAKLSVPSVLVWAESEEKIHWEFAIKDVAPEDGLLVRIVSICKEYIPSAPAPVQDPAPESKQEPAK